MKNVQKSTILTFLLLLGCFCSLDASAQTNDEILSIVRASAKSAACQVMQKVSPNTGQSPDFEIDYESVVYDSNARQIECNVILSWSAKQYMLSFTRDTCKTWGKLYVNLSDGSSKYVAKGENNWFVKCANSHWADTLKNGLNILR